MASAAPENAEQVPQGAETQQQQTQQAEEEEEAVIAPSEPKVMTRRDISLKEFLNKMDDYAPIVSGRRRPVC